MDAHLIFCKSIKKLIHTKGLGYQVLEMIVVQLLNREI